MKKVAFLSAISLFLTTSVAYAVTLDITPPTQGYNDLGNFITNFLQLAMGLALLVVLVMLIWGAFEWITSGGDKEAVGKARGRILNALIGLAVLAIAFALATVGAQFLGFTDLKKITIPGPNNKCIVTPGSSNNNGCPAGTTCNPTPGSTATPVEFTCQ